METALQKGLWLGERLASTGLRRKLDKSANEIEYQACKLGGLSSS